MFYKFFQGIINVPNLISNLARASVDSNRTLGPAAADKLWRIDSPLPEGFSLASAYAVESAKDNVYSRTATYKHESGMRLCISSGKASESAPLETLRNALRSNWLRKKGSTIHGDGTIMVGGQKLSYIIGKYEVASSGKKSAVLEGEFEPTGRSIVTVRILSTADRPLNMHLIESFFSRVRAINN